MRADLQHAHRVAGLTGTLEDALSRPLLARCLEITARALANAAPAFNSVPRTASVDMPMRESMTNTAPRKDFKRASAADVD